MKPRAWKRTGLFILSPCAVISALMLAVTTYRMVDQQITVGAALMRMAVISPILAALMIISGLLQEKKEQ